MPITVVHAPTSAHQTISPHQFAVKAHAQVLAMLDTWIAMETSLWMDVRFTLPQTLRIAVDVVLCARAITLLLPLVQLHHALVNAMLDILIAMAISCRMDVK